MEGVKLQHGYDYNVRLIAGTYQGQWVKGMRHGYGVRTSAPFGLASHYKPSSRKEVRSSMTSLTSAGTAGGGGGTAAPTPEPTDRRDRRVDDSRGGFVLRARSDQAPTRRKSLTEKSLKKGLLSVSVSSSSLSSSSSSSIHPLISSNCRA